MRSLIFAVALVCFWVCLPITSPTLAATRYVDSSVSASGDGMSWETALKTIQEGIDAASEGDTVIVAEGTYVENINFNGKNIILTSTDPLDADAVAFTIIDGNRDDSVVTFSGTEGESCSLSGFTIRNGRAQNGGGICGGNESQHTHATIKHNVVTENSAGNGGALSYSDGTIECNRINANQGEGYGAACTTGTARLLAT